MDLLYTAHIQHKLLNYIHLELKILIYNSRLAYSYSILLPHPEKMFRIVLRRFEDEIVRRSSIVPTDCIAASFLHHPHAVL